MRGSIGAEEGEGEDVSVGFDGEDVMRRRSILLHCV